MPDGSAIAAAYGRAGNGFLAFKLEGMFRHLETPEDIALHNVIQREVMLMMGDDKQKLDAFYRLLEHKLLNRKIKARWSFAKMVANLISGEL